MSNIPDAPNYSMLLSRLTGSGQWDRAFETARQWLATEPENTQAHLVAGQSLVNLERYPEAQPHVSLVLQNEPENAFAYRLMSIICFHQNQFKLADDAIQKAISLEPHEHRNWYHLAHMSYKQGDSTSARSFAEKARELNPRDANTINLLAMCGPEGISLSKASTRELDLYMEALELDPENALIHNNIGVHYLNVAKDYKTAEQYFRQGLFFDPSSKLIRNNLFVTLKHSDAFYKVICWPRTILVKFSSLATRARHRSIFTWLLLFPVWVFAARFVIGGLALWFMFFWPLLKVYEHLTIGDILSKAGEIGAKRGGLLGYRGWPFKLRMAIFFFGLLLFWGGVFVLGQNENGRTVLFVLLGSAIAIVVAVNITRSIKRSRQSNHARRRAKRMRYLIQPEKQKSKRWVSRFRSDSHE
ncbi:MAG: tetratricopeptide repeat protein [Chthoniobacteraceae bacterium]